MQLDQAKKKAKELSLTEDYKGCSVHVNYSILKVGYVLSDWYDSENTVHTYIDGIAQ